MAVIGIRGPDQEFAAGLGRGPRRRGEQRPGHAPPPPGRQDIEIGQQTARHLGLRDVALPEKRIADRNALRCFGNDGGERRIGAEAIAAQLPGEARHRRPADRALEVGEELGEHRAIRRAGGPQAECARFADSAPPGRGTARPRPHTR